MKYECDMIEKFCFIVYKSLFIGFSNSLLNVNIVPGAIIYSRSFWYCIFVIIIFNFFSLLFNSSWVFFHNFMTWVLKPDIIALWPLKCWNSCWKIITRVSKSISNVNNVVHCLRDVFQQMSIGTINIFQFFRIIFNTPQAGVSLTVLCNVK